MPGIDRTRPEDMEPIDAAAYLCWGSGRGDLYDAVHAMKRENERLREYERLVNFIAGDYIELSHDKAQWQRDDWYKRCQALQQKGIE